MPTSEEQQIINPRPLNHAPFLSIQRSTYNFHLTIFQSGLIMRINYVAQRAHDNTR